MMGACGGYGLTAMYGACAISVGFNGAYLDFMGVYGVYGDFWAVY